MIPMEFMEDLEYTTTMIQPIKQLNLDDLVPELQKLDNKNDYENVEVIFTIMYDGVYEIRENKLLVNFFRIKPSDFEDKTYVDGIEIKQFMKEKLTELLSK